MSYPIKLELGFTFDLRYFPFIIAALYGGYKVSFPLMAVVIVYRLVVAGNGVIQSLLLSTVIFIVVPLLHKKFITLNSTKRIWCAAAVAVGIILTFLSTLTRYYETLNQEYWTIAINSIMVYFVGMIIIMSLIEKIISNSRFREKLVTTEQMNVISELSASISHEIRNPLTVTSGFLQLLNKSKSITSEEKWYIELSLQELNRAEKIVSDFLTLGKPQSVNMVDCNFREEINYVKDVITPYANLHKVSIELNFTNTLTKTYDKNQIQQCLLNLYKNGIEAMKDDGGILSIDVYNNENTIVFKITDTGIGMSKEDISRLGKPYYSTKHEGTGLGMLMVFSAITKLEGKIEITSQIGKGTTFFITIPAS